jgi:hypothetical protein
VARCIQIDPWLSFLFVVVCFPDKAGTVSELYSNTLVGDSIRVLHGSFVPPCVVQRIPPGARCIGRLRRASLQGANSCFLFLPQLDEKSHWDVHRLLELPFLLVIQLEFLDDFMVREA